MKNLNKLTSKKLFFIFLFTFSISNLSFSQDGGWSEWSEWTLCDGTSRQRFRQCNNPTPANGGADCVGPNIETQSCSDGGWSEWSEWSICNDIMVTRSRTCTEPVPVNGGQYCNPPNLTFPPFHGLL